MQKQAAIVTGGGTGIGKSTSLLLASKGFKVVVNYSRSAKEAEETCAEIIKLGGEAIPYKANISDDKAVKEMAQKCSAMFGGIDVLVNNAGTTHFIDHNDLDALTDQVWDDIFSVNMKGTFYACRAVMPELKKSRGNIVNVTSVAGLAGNGSSIPYAMSKAALNCMTKSLAKAFAPEVRVNAVAPGLLDTPAAASLIASDASREMAARQYPIVGIGNAPDVARLMAWLLSEQAARVTGQIWSIDGGFSSIRPMIK